MLLDLQNTMEQPSNRHLNCRRNLLVSLLRVLLISIIFGGTPSNSNYLFFLTKPLFEVWISEFAFWSFYISRLIFSKKLRKRLWFYISKLKVLMVFRTYWIWPWIFVLSILFSNSVLVNSYCLYISWLLCIIFSSFGPAYLSIFEISGRPNYSLFR